MRDGDFLPLEANIDLVNLQTAVLEDSVIRAILLAESRRIRRIHAVDVSHVAELPHRGWSGCDEQQREHGNV
jgi:hypothetical protein